MITEERMAELKKRLAEEALRALNEDFSVGDFGTEGFLAFGDIEYMVRVIDLLWEEESEHPQGTYFEVECECESSAASEIGDIYIYLKYENKGITIMDIEEINALGI